MCVWNEKRCNPIISYGDGMWISNPEIFSIQNTKLYVSKSFKFSSNFKYICLSLSIPKSWYNECIVIFWIILLYAFPIK